MLYFIRSVKYFLAMCVLCVVIMLLNLATGFSNLSFDQTIYVLFHTSRSLLLLGALVVLAAAYPRFGFVTRKVEGDTTKHREQIINAFRAAGFSLRKEEDEVMYFRADRVMHKLLLLGEDEIKVSQYGQWILIDGIRRGVAKVEYRLDSYIQMQRNE